MLEKNVLMCVPSDQQDPISLSEMVEQQYTTNPNSTLTCDCTCTDLHRCAPGTTRLIGTTLKALPGQLHVIAINRNIDGIHRRIVTPVIEPAPHKAWDNKDLRAVITHEVHGFGRDIGMEERRVIESSGGHYIPYIKKENTWWKLDSGTGKIVIENPFINQITSNTEDGKSIIVFFFK